MPVKGGGLADLLKFLQAVFNSAIRFAAIGPCPDAFKVLIGFNYEVSFFSYLSYL